MNRIPFPQSGHKREFERLVSRPYFFVRYSAAKHIRYDLHSHHALTVTSILEGEMNIRVDQSEHLLISGQAALTNIDQQHSGWGSDVRYMTVRLVPSFVLEILQQTSPEVPGNDIRFLSSVTSDAEVHALAGSIAAEIATEKLGQAAMLEALVRQMVIHLLRGHMAVRKSAVIELSRVGPVDRRLRLAIEFMHDN